MKSVFHLLHPVTFPKDLESFKAQGTGYVYGQIRILECSVKQYVNTTQFFSGTLLSYAPYFKYSGFLKFSPEKDKLIVANDSLGLRCTLLYDDRILISHLRYFKQELPDIELVAELQEYINKQRENHVLTNVLTTQSFCTEQFKHNIDYFRIEQEMPIVDLFTVKRTHLISVQQSLRKLPIDRIIRLRHIMQYEPWLLCFEKWSKKLYGLKRLTFAQFKKHVDSRRIHVPHKEYTAVREYQEIHNRRAMGHTLFHIDSIKHNRDEILDYLLYKGIRYVDEQKTLFSTLADYTYANGIVDWINKLTMLPPSDYSSFRTTNIRPCIPAVAFTGEQLKFIQHLKRPETRLAFLQGGPGTGKSETGLVWLLSHFSRPLMVTYTGMMVDAGQKRIGRPEVMNTIHYIITIAQMIAYGPQWLAAFDLIVFDESSNIDTKLLYQILKVVPAACKLVMLGDLGQIFPISPGCPFADLFQYFDTSTFVLTENKRVNANSRTLADASACIRNGSIEGIQWDSDALHILDDITDIEVGIDRFLSKYCHHIDDIMRIQFVTLRNQDRKIINASVRKWLLKHRFLSDSRKITITTRKKLLYKEKITFTKNQKDPSQNAVKNGELCQVISSKFHKKSKGMQLTLNTGKTVLIHRTEGIDPSTIESGYGSTCNKAQGSEWDYVFFYIHPEAATQEWWSRSYPYVAISRAKQHCTIMGTKHALRDICKREQPPRHTLLQYLLQHGSSKLEKDDIMDIRDDLLSEDTSTYELLDAQIAAVPQLKDFAPKEPLKKRKSKK